MEYMSEEEIRRRVGSWELSTTTKDKKVNVYDNGTHEVFQDLDIALANRLIAAREVYLDVVFKIYLQYYHEQIDKIGP